MTFKRWLATGLALGTIGCGGGSDGGSAGDGWDEPSAQLPAEPVQRDQPARPGVAPDTTPEAGPPTSTAVPGNPQIPVSHALAALARASSCDDLLTRVQDDAVAKLKMSVERYRKQPAHGVSPGGGTTGGLPIVPPSPSAPIDDRAESDSSGSPQNAGSGSGGGDFASDRPVPVDPVAASDTNAQVEGVDEADFVKVVDDGKAIYLLHGNTLRKLRSWPAAQTALASDSLKLEGTPSEMFVSEEGKAVIFSTVTTFGRVSLPALPSSGACTPGLCQGYPRADSVKITIADVSTSTPVVERELYYEGSYVSSRSYEGEQGDVVRAVIQSYSKFQGLFYPQIQWADAWGRPYEQAEIDSQLAEWQARTEASIRDTALSDWFPVAQEVVDGALVELEPSCDSYFVPDPGLADYGLTHVVSLDLAQPKGPVGGITVVGGASTVYSNAERLVLAQPDYRWNPTTDFGIVDQEQTALHMFTLSGASTGYVASGWVSGTLPRFNPQFGIDVASDQSLRLATTGRVRDQPDAAPDAPEFWLQHTENHVYVARQSGNTLEVVGKSDKLGHEGESVQSARFLGDRAYVVTFRQTDPLIVLDVADATKPTVLGELEIPGFSQYVHPLDATHLITVGQGEAGNIRLQLFDVTDPANLPEPRTYDFGDGSSSEVSYNHKAFTSFEGGLLALPVYGQYFRGDRYDYRASLEVLAVDPATGFSPRASIDHAPLYADNGAGVSCGVCEPFLGCFGYTCGYVPEVRRGHFVKGADGKVYVYSISHAGVLVHELAPQRQVARVGLPAPELDPVSWHDPVVTDAGVAMPTP